MYSLTTFVLLRDGEEAEGARREGAAADGSKSQTWKRHCRDHEVLRRQLCPAHKNERWAEVKGKVFHHCQNIVTSNLHSHTPSFSFYFSVNIWTRCSWVSHWYDKWAYSSKLNQSKQSPGSDLKSITLVIPKFLHNVFLIAQSKWPLE